MLLCTLQIFKNFFYFREKWGNKLFIELGIKIWSGSKDEGCTIAHFQHDTDVSPHPLKFSNSSDYSQITIPNIYENSFLHPICLSVWGECLKNARPFWTRWWATTCAAQNVKHYYPENTLVFKNLIWFRSHCFYNLLKCSLRNYWPSYCYSKKIWNTNFYFKNWNTNFYLKRHKTNFNFTDCKFSVPR